MLFQYGLRDYMVSEIVFKTTAFPQISQQLTCEKMNKCNSGATAEFILRQQFRFTNKKTAPFY